MNELTHEDLTHFSGNLQYRLQLLAKTRQHTDRLLATRFNSFDYIQPNENRLSDILADLLDPGGSHGQADAFLKVFIGTMCKRTPATWKFRSVRRENTTSSITNDKRRMDILIDLDTFGIAIENKPWANEQKEQLHDYVAHLERRFTGSFAMIYLSPNGAQPTSLGAFRREQLLRDEKLILCAYGGRLRGWLARCHQICAAEKIRWFLADFLAFIEQTFPAEKSILDVYADE